MDALLYLGACALLVQYGALHYWRHYTAFGSPAYQRGYRLIGIAGWVAILSAAAYLVLTYV